MKQMFKVIILAGPALISSYANSPRRLTNILGPVQAAIAGDVVALLGLEDRSGIPPMVWRDVVNAIEAGVDKGQRADITVGLTSVRGRHEMYDGGPAPLIIRVRPC